MIDPEDHRGGDADALVVFMSESVVSCCDPPPVFEPAEHVSRFAKIGRMAASAFAAECRAVCPWRAGLPKLVAILALVADQGFGAFRQRRIDQRGADVIAGLARR